jgi:hypothetical protein
MSKYKWTPQKFIVVYCKECNEWMGENITKIKNIEEDLQGRDFLTFECPACKTTQKSHRVG